MIYAGAEQTTAKKGELKSERADQTRRTKNQDDVQRRRTKNHDDVECKCRAVNLIANSLNASQGVGADQIHRGPWHSGVAFCLFTARKRQQSGTVA
jgi:hypothetical protein